MVMGKIVLSLWCWYCTIHVGKYLFKKEAMVNKGNKVDLLAIYDWITPK